MIVFRCALKMEGSMEERGAAKSHKIIITNRKDSNITGVVDVISFDVEEVKIDTEQGMLVIKGTDLHVKNLNLEKGQLDIEGVMDSFTYTHVKKNGDGESFLSRMFK